MNKSGMNPLFEDVKNAPKALDVLNIPTDSLKLFLEKMILVRKVEQKLATAKKSGVIGGPVHLSVGQEAVPVGVSHSLNTGDTVFGAHRSHGHLLALSDDPYPLFAEVLGRSTGASKGMGGSMHLWDEASGFLGSVPIVAGSVSIAVGAALGVSLQKNKENVVIAYLGDGAMEEGVVAESLNLATVRNLPIVFVVENNLFASHMHISTRQPRPDISRFAGVNGMRSATIDGNDVGQVMKVCQKFIEYSRKGGGPSLLEAITFRWFGHVDWREDVDVGVNRSPEDIKNWKRLDPIARLSKELISTRKWSASEQSKLDEKIDQRIEGAWARALTDPVPDPKVLLDYVYV